MRQCALCVTSNNSGISRGFVWFGQTTLYLLSLHKTAVANAKLAKCVFLSFRVPHCSIIHGSSTSWALHLSDCLPGFALGPQWGVQLSHHNITNDESPGSTLKSLTNVSYCRSTLFFIVIINNSFVEWFFCYIKQLTCTTLQPKDVDCWEKRLKHTTNIYKHCCTEFIWYVILCTHFN